MTTENKDIERLYEVYHLKMVRLAWMLLGGKQEAEDVVSDVFAKMLDDNDKLLPRSEEGYLMMAVRNRCKNVVAHKSVKERVVKLMADANRPEGWPPAEDRLASIIEFTEHHLPPLTQRIFHLRHIQGMSYQEIADEVGVSKVTVYHHLSDAVDKAKAYFKDK